ncbi:MAG: hypothetical protein ACR2QL_08680 [Woeseiaceae bacterium]
MASILALGACTNQPTIDESVPSFVGGMPADLSGSWARDYTRSDDLQAVLNSTLRRMYRPMPDSQYPAPMQDPNKTIALARLADLITRPDVLTIAQNDYEVKVARKDDFTMLCEFYDGYSKRTESEFGAEVCSWDGRQLVSYLTLPDGLLVSHRFTLSTDGKRLLVTTAVSSSGARNPFVINRAYMKFEPPESDFNCIETLSMKRVCSTGEITP